MPLRIGIVEDSQENIDVLLYMLEKSGVETEVVGIAKTVSEAELVLTRPDLDAALLDIQLKEGTIFDVLNSVEKKVAPKYDIVFITAHGTYENALKAIRFSCLDFLNKPLDQEELNATLNKLEQKALKKEGDNRLSHLLEVIKEGSDIPRSMGVILSKGVIEFIEVVDLVYIEADQSISRLFLRNGEKLNSSKHLGYYIDLLADHPDFLQSSKSHLINLNEIKQYDHKERTVKFKDGRHVIASFRFSKMVKSRLMERQSKGGFFRGGLDKLGDLFR